jgi:hypothetical protein
MSSIDTYLTETNRKHRRRRRYFLFAAVIALVGLLCIGAGWLVFRSPFVQVAQVIVQGNERVAADDIKAVAIESIFSGSLVRRALGPGNMLAWISGDLSGNALKSFPAVRDIAIRRNYRDRTVTLVVTERHAAGIWCFSGQAGADTTQVNADQAGTNVDTGTQMSTNATVQMSTDGMSPSVGTATTQTSTSSVDLQSNPGSASAFRCFWFDADGVLFDRAPVAEGNIIRVIHDYSQKNIGLGALILPQQFVPNLFSILRVLDASGIGIEEIRLDDIGLEELNVITYNGPKLLFSLRFPSDNALTVLKKMTDRTATSSLPDLKKLQYVDFRVENRAYYK